MRTPSWSGKIVCSLALASACGGEAGSKPAGEQPRAEAPATGAKAGAPPGSAGAPASDWDWKLGPGLHAPPFCPDDNPMSADKVALGHALFMDKRLSGDGSRSCYSCHQNELGNADGRAKALGAGDKPLPRNTPTIWNVAYHASLYWDGRAVGLEAQALGALKGGNMGVGADNLAAKAAELGALDEYRDGFRRAFALNEGDAVTIEHVCKALSAYQRTLLCGDTLFDRGEMDESARRGWDLFRGKAGCASCHAGDNFSEGLFHQVGIGFDEQGQPIEGSADVGRVEVTKDEADRYKLRTPTLRNVSKTTPYFHDGSVATLEEAVGIMARGGNRNAPGLDPLLEDKGLTAAELADVVAFLRALDCPGRLEVLGDQTVAGITGEPAPVGLDPAP